MYIYAFKDTHINIPGITLNTKNLEATKCLSLDEQINCVAK